MNLDDVPGRVSSAPFLGSGESTDLGWQFDEHLLTRHPLPAAAPPGLQAVADVFRSASAPPHPTELAGKEAAIAAFDVAGAELLQRRVRRRRKSMLASLVTAKLALAGAAVALPIGGLSAAAFTGSLPDAAQDLAHSWVGAPKASGGQGPDESPNGDPSQGVTVTPSVDSVPGATSSAVGPDAQGTAAFGLCNAWSKGGLGTTSTAYRNLAAAAGGADKIESYCDDVEHPGAPKATPSASTTPDADKNANKNNNGNPNNGNSSNGNANEDDAQEDDASSGQSGESHGQRSTHPTPTNTRGAHS